MTTGMRYLFFSFRLLTATRDKTATAAPTIDLLSVPDDTAEKGSSSRFASFAATSADDDAIPGDEEDFGGLMVRPWFPCLLNTLVETPSVCYSSLLKETEQR